MTFDHADESERRSHRRRTTDFIRDNGLPWQVKAIGFIGIPSTIALYLTYVMAGTMTKNTADVKDLLSEHHMVTRTLIQQNETIIRVMRTGCVNAAKTYDERARCQQ